MNIATRACALVAAGILALAGGAETRAAEKPADNVGPLVQRRNEMAQRIRRQYARSAEKLQISNIAPSADRVGLFHRYELSFSLDGRYENPFDPEQIQVDAQITRPDGSQVVVPAFFMQPFESADGQTRIESDTMYKPGGQPGWRLRYSPTQAGEHQVILKATQADPAETVESAPITFIAESSDHPGFVQVSMRNPYYFEFSGNGELFYATGANVPWTRTTHRNPELGSPEGTYERYFGAARGHMSATRVWQCHFGWIEWMPQADVSDELNSWSGYGGANFYNQMVSSAFDRVFEMAEDAGFCIMLVLDDNDEHMLTGPSQHQWWGNPNNVINGGWCEKPHEIFTNENARKNYRKRLRYIMARWGYSPSLWAINTWNDCSNPSPQHLDWLREMHGYVHSLADAWRPIIFGTNYAFAAQEISDYAQAKTAGLVPGKPNVVQEAYFTRNGDWFVDTLKHEIWKNMARGCGGVMVWPHHMIYNRDAWKHFGSVLTFVDGLKLNETEFRQASARVTSASVDGSAIRVLAAAPYGDIPNWAARATEENFVIDATAGSQFLLGFAPKLYGQRSDCKEWRTEPTFTFELPGDGSFIVDLGELAGDGVQELVATIDDGERVALPLEGTGRRETNAQTRFYSFPLKAGSHKLKLSLEGPRSDWVAVRKFLLVYNESEPSRLLDVYGITSDRQAAIYLRNSTCGELPEGTMGLTPAVIRNVKLQVDSLADGEYDVVLYSVDEGREISRTQASVTGGTCNVSIPAVDRHIAVKLLGR